MRPGARWTVCAALVAVAVFGAVAPVASAAAPDATCETLQDVLDGSQENDVITLEEGSVCSDPDDLEPVTLPSHAIVLQGTPGGVPEVLSGEDEEQVLRGADVGATIIRNLTFRDGNGGGEDGDGAAIEIIGSSSPTLSNIQVYGNDSIDRGAVTIDTSGGGGTVTVEDSTFGNSAQDGNAARRGGGLYVDTAHAIVLARNTFTGNLASLEGGGAVVSLGIVDDMAAGAPVTLSDNTFGDNAVESLEPVTAALGGGLSIVTDSPGFRAVAQSGNSFSGNTIVARLFPGFPAFHAGGGEYSEASILSTDDRYLGNAIEGIPDEGEIVGGALAVAGFELEFVGRNLVAADNSIDQGAGGAIWLGRPVGGGEGSSALRLLDSTLVANQSGTGDGSAIAGRLDDSLVLHNSIVHGNSGTGPEIAGFDDGGSIEILFSDVCAEGSPASGEGNLCADPRLVAPAEGDVHQQDDSPTLDAGSNELIPDGLSEDYEGDDRIIDAGNDGARVDMGADEAPTGAVQSDPGPGGGGAGGGGAGGGGLIELPPSLGSLALGPRSFWAANRGPSLAARVGTRVSYTLSEPAVTRFTVERAAPGRRVRRRCAKPTARNRRARRCTRYVRLRGSFSHVGRAGTNSFRFTGRLARRKLKPGNYRLVALATDGQGKRSAPKRAKFRIVRR